MGKILHKIKNCGVCQGTKLIYALNLGMHPMCDDIVEANDSRICK
jgi:hypothetical protein